MSHFPVHSFDDLVTKGDLDGVTARIDAVDRDLTARIDSLQVR